MAIRVVPSPGSSQRPMGDDEAGLLTFTEGRDEEVGTNTSGWLLNYRATDSDAIRSHFIAGSRDDAAWVQQEARRFLEGIGVDTSSGSDAPDVVDAAVLGRDAQRDI